MSDNVKPFSKEKRPTPEDINYPIAHECLSGHQSLKWMLQIRADGVHAVCTDCATAFGLLELVNYVMKEE